MKIGNTEFGVIDLSPTVGTRGNSLKLRATPNCITFNTAFCKALNYPPYVDVYINTDTREVAFKGLKDRTATCRNFYQPRAKNSNQGNCAINWSGKKIVEAMNTILNKKEDRQNFTGELKEGTIVINIGRQKQ